MAVTLRIIAIEEEGEEGELEVTGVVLKLEDMARLLLDEAVVIKVVLEDTPVGEVVDIEELKLEELYERVSEDLLLELKEAFAVENTEEILLVFREVIGAEDAG